MTMTCNAAPPDQDALVAGIPADVKEAFARLSSELFAKGFWRYSADAVLHRVRWELEVERGRREYKCNNNWTAPLARWFMKEHPEVGDFFETRSRKADNDNQDREAA